ncbi:MAG: UbiD family decarboxylase [Vicinamibacteria bacterium]|nr:UbiD family decarboxylase [Vicinamibacteria bacterium]
MSADLREFMAVLRRESDIVEIDAPVDAHLEAAEIHRRVIAAGGPALLFKNVIGADFPLVTNLFGTAKRAEMAFGGNAAKFVRRAVDVVQHALPPTLGKAWNARDLVMSGLKVGLKRSSGGPVTEVREGPNLAKLPALTCWPEDGGPFITLPLVLTAHPGGLGTNLGMYRMQIYDARTTGMHWQIGKGGGFHYDVAERQGESLPLSVFVGGPPALILSAIAPLPENLPELLLASLIIGERLEMVEGVSQVPLVANAEFALVGRVPSGVRRPEGPFGDHYGYYSLVHDYPVFEIDRVYRRRDAIYPATVVGKPRQEDFFIGDLLQDLLSPLFPLVMPQVKALWSYGETGYHSLAAAIVQERYEREAMASAFRILGEGQLSLTKFLLLTDSSAGLDLKDFRATLTHILERTTPETDLFVFPNLSMDTLDYTTPTINRGSKGVWMGVGPKRRELPREFRGSPGPSVTDIRVFSPGCLVVGAPPYRGAQDEEARAIAGIAADPAFAEWPLVVVSDEPARAAKSTINFLWTTFTRFEPARDIYGARQALVAHHLALSPPIVIDARTKPWYPKELFADEATAKKVTGRWSEYFQGGKVEMGDSEKAHLD